MNSTSIPATWSRACCSVLAIGALTVSAASADLRTSRVAIDRASSVTSELTAGQPVDANIYQVRLAFADGSPVSETVVITDSEGNPLQRVTPGADGMLRFAGQPGTKFGVSLPSAVTELGTGDIHGAVYLTDSPDLQIDVIVDGAPGAPQDQTNSATPGLRGSFTGLNATGLEQVGPGMVVNVGSGSCDTATAIAIGASDAGTTVGAPNNQSGATFCGATVNAGPKVWYSVVGNGNRLTANTCAPTPGAMDSKIWVFRQCGTPCGAATLLCLGGNDDFCAANPPSSAFQSSVSWDSVAGDTYKIVVGGFGSTTAGPYTLSIVNGAPSTAPNPCPPPPEPTGACCVTSAAPYSQGEVPVSCSIETASDCADLGGVYGGDDVPCVSGTVTFTEFDASPNLAIPDSPGANVPGAVASSTITVPAIAGGSSIVDVNVETDITHTFISDLNIDVIHNSTTVRLWSRDCGAGANIHATADDEGTTVTCAALSAGGADTDGDGFGSDSLTSRYPPVAATLLALLSNYDGGEAGGAWTYEVRDNFIGDIGVINHWGLELTYLSSLVNQCADVDCSAGTDPCQDPSGHTLICHVPPGNPDNAHEIVVGNSAVPAHLAHGDTCGPCNP